MYVYSKEICKYKELVFTQRLRNRGTYYVGPTYDSEDPAMTSAVSQVCLCNGSVFIVGLFQLVLRCQLCTSENVREKMLVSTTFHNPPNL